LPAPTTGSTIFSVFIRFIRLIAVAGAHPKFLPSIPKFFDPNPEFLTIKQNAVLKSDKNQTKRGIKPVFSLIVCKILIFTYITILLAPTKWEP
jgi:hypothetical protein